MGTIITFYSYKGGVGRTMALANVAVLLAQWRKKVLIVDWDLEAPGVEHFFYDEPEELRSVQNRPGLIDLLSDSTQEDSEIRYRELLSTVSLKDVPDFQLLTAGARTSGYFKSVRALDFKSFYEDRDGGQIIERLRSTWKEAFDFVLIDSRTGITDIGGICTIQLPDILALIFTATRQSLDGAVEVARKAAVERQKLPFDRAQVPVLPLPSRFDTQTEHVISQKWLDDFERELTPLYKPWLTKEADRRRFLESTKIPYAPYFSFGEKLPVIEQGSTDPSGLGFAYETIAALIANNLQQPELVLDNRDEFIRLARTSPPLKQASTRPILESSLLYLDLTSSTRLAAAAREEAFRRFYEIIKDANTVCFGDVAMSSGDGVLLSFQDARAAVQCAFYIQESLAVRKPIVTPLGPLRVRMGIYAAGKNAPSTKESVIKVAGQIANKAREGQIVASDRVHNLVHALNPFLVGPAKGYVRFAASEELVEYQFNDTTIEEPIFDAFSIVPVTLTEGERRALFDQPPETASRGGFQAFLVGLQKKVNLDTNTLELTVVDRERIARYAHDYRGGGWQAKLRKIFARTLGSALGRDKKPSSEQRLF
jgi:MinD-like ATPase involved in chromosome partitioning or flagellar assembly/class 3 adenylate cyclase